MPDIFDSLTLFVFSNDLIFRVTLFHEKIYSSFACLLIDHVFFNFPGSAEEYHFTKTKFRPFQFIKLISTPLTSHFTNSFQVFVEKSIV